MNSLTIAVDIDGVLTLETKGHDYATRTPNNANIDRVRTLFEQGHTIILYTARWEQDRELTEKQMNDWGVPFKELVMGKLKYDLLIDDLSMSRVPSVENVLSFCWLQEQGS